MEDVEITDKDGFIEDRAEGKIVKGKIAEGKRVLKHQADVRTHGPGKRC